jgi:hypothetical protein
MKRIILLFIASFLVTAIFSSSLKVFFADISWREVLIKGLVIPCFTWTVQLLLSTFFLDRARRIVYWTCLGWVCLIGSIALLPAACYNFLTAQPLVQASVINVLASVVIMTLCLQLLLKRRGFKLAWTLSFVVLIVINMSLYLYSVI